MAWIKSDQNLANHPKLKLLAKELGISEITALGHLHLFWYWTLEYADNGHIKYPELVEEACKWTGDEDIFLNGLIKYGFIDEVYESEINNCEYYVHDWLDYSGAYYEKKLYNRIKKQETREKLQQKQDILEDLTSFDNGLTKLDGQELDKNREEKNRIDKNNIGLATQDGTVSNSNRDLIFETLATVCGYDWKGVMTQDERGRLNKAVKQLKDIGATPEDIELRAKNFVLSYGFNPAPQSITGLYSKLVKVQPKLNKKQMEEIQRQAINTGRWEDMKEKHGQN